MNIEVTKDILIILSLLISLGTSLWVWSQSGSKANKEAMGKIGDHLTDVDRRLRAVEGEMRHLPDKEQVTDMRLAVTEMRGTIGKLEETVGSIGRTVHRMETYMIEKGVRA